MNFKKILLATAVALTASTNAFAAPPPSSGLTLTGVTPTSTTPAVEAQFAAGAFTGDLAFTLNSGATLPLNTPMRLTVTLPAGVKYKTQVAAGDAVPGAAGTVTLASGGAVNSNTVTFLVTMTANTTSIVVTSDVFVEGCTGLAATELKVDLVVDASGTGIEGGTVSTSASDTPTAPAVAGPVNACKEAFTATIKPYTLGGGFEPVLTLATDYKAFHVAPGRDFAAVGSVQEIATAGVDRDWIGTDAVSATDLLSMDFTVTVEDGSVFKNVQGSTSPAGTFTGNSAKIVGETSSAYNFTLHYKDITTVKSAQAAVQVSAVKLNLNTANGFVATKTLPDATVSPITREVSNGGTFDWTSEEGANSVFRITGLSAPTKMIVTSANSNKGVNKSWSATVTPVNGEVVVSSLSGLGVGASGFGRADMTFTFETAAGVDVDRLIVQAGDIFELQSVTD